MRLLPKLSTLCRTGFVCCLAALGLWHLFPLPLEEIERVPDSWRLLDREGSILRVELTPEELRSDPISLEQAGEWVPLALVAAEDKRFFEHPGIDPVAVMRSTAYNLKAGRVVTGASTLSTQVIRMSHPRARHLGTKGVEAFRALQMEQQLDKEEILAQYLNRAPFGSNFAGIQAASKGYFGKDAKDLTLGEAALLMGLPQSPSRFRPDRHLDRALKRREFVLERMRVNAYITAEQERVALAQPLDHLRRYHAPFRAPHFCDLVGQLRDGRARAGDTRTTIDAALQALAETAAARHHQRLAVQDIHGLGMVILEVKTGAVRALVGSPDYFNEEQAGQVNMAWAERSPGSTLKPFAFAMAADAGMLTADTILGDVPMRFRDYNPKNFSHSFRGPVSARDALVQSLNLPALAVVRDLGLDAFASRLRALGLGTIDQGDAAYGLSLVLGTAEVRLLELANAYACLAREGDWLPCRLVDDEAPAPACRLFSPGACYLVADMLSGCERALQVEGHAAEVVQARFAWKTGTSMGFRDAWTVGWNPEYVVAVWTGNPDGRGSSGLVGTEAAAPVVLDVFRALYPSGEAPWYAQPADLTERSICAVSGQRCGAHCPVAETGLALRGISDPRPCTVHPRDGVERWPAAIAAWLTAQRQEPQAGALRITSPAGGSRFVLSESADNRIQLEAEGAGRKYWFVDGAYLGSGASLWWPLAAGEHQVVCSDGGENTARATVVVR